jgi:hypothetical protein
MPVELPAFGVQGRSFPERPDFFQEREIREPLTDDSTKESLIACMERSLARLNEMGMGE